MPDEAIDFVWIPHRQQSQVSMRKKPLRCILGLRNCTNGLSTLVVLDILLFGPHSRGAALRRTLGKQGGTQLWLHAPINALIQQDAAKACFAFQVGHLAL